MEVVDQWSKYIKERLKGSLEIMGLLESSMRGMGDEWNLCWDRKWGLLGSWIEDYIWWEWMKEMIKEAIKALKVWMRDDLGVIDKSWIRGDGKEKRDLCCDVKWVSQGWETCGCSEESLKFEWERETEKSRVFTLKFWSAENPGWLKLVGSHKGLTSLSRQKRWEKLNFEWRFRRIFHN